MRIVLPPGCEHVRPGRERGGRHAYAEVVGPDVPATPGRVNEHQPEEQAGRTADEVAARAGEDVLGHRAGGAPGWRRRLAGALADHIPPTVRGARWRLTGRAAAGVTAGLLLAVGAAALAAGRDSAEMITPEVVTVTTAAGSEPSPTGSSGHGPSTASAVVVVHVAGLVAAPGVFELPVGSRVVDALEAAGGVQPGVDTSTLNLARVLIDGEQIAVGVPAAPDAGGSGPGGDPSPGLPLDLNTATEAELDSLPGIGPVLAGRIVAWRGDHGAFTAVEELLEVSGIGTATLADLAGLVRV